MGRAVGLISTASLIASLVMQPEITAQPSGLSGAGSLVFDIKNDNVLPILWLTYTCVNLNIEPVGGFQLRNNLFLNDDKTKVLWPRATKTARCQDMAVNTNAPIRAAAAQVTIRYTTLPWPFQQTATHVVDALIQDGRIVNWLVR